MGVAIDPLLALTLRLSLALLLAASARHKLRDHASFGAALRAYALLPAPFVAIAALLLTASELGTAIGLLLPATARLAAVGAALLFAIYATAIAINLARGRRDLDCGCSGPLQRRPVSRALVVRNALLIGAALTAALPIGTRTLVWVDAFTLSAVVVVSAMLYLAVDTLVAQAPNWALRSHPPESSHA